MEYSNYTKLQFGTRLQEIRIKRGYRTQTEFAEAYKKKFGSIRNRNDKETNSMLRTIQSWETGKSVPPCTILCNLCELLHCDADYLLDRLNNSTHDLDFICKQTRLEEVSVKELQRLPDFSHYVNYLTKGIIPYCSEKELKDLFGNIEKFIQEKDERQSAITMLELQQSLITIKNNIKYQEKDARKRLF